MSEPDLAPPTLLDSMRRDAQQGEDRRRAREEVMRAARAAMERARALEAQLRDIAVTIPTIEEQAARIVTSALASVGGSVAIAGRLVGDKETGHIVLDGAVHLPPHVYAAHELTPMSSDSPLTRVVRTNQVLTCGNDHDILREFPSMADVLDATGARALAAVPVMYLGEVRGAFAVLFPTPRQFAGPERAHLRALGALYARALRHARLYFSEREARQEAERAHREADRARRDAESVNAAFAIAHAELEARIDERTRELAQLNDALTGEIVERARAEDERNELRRQLISAEEAERRRIALELHDQLGQHLTALTLGLDEVTKMLAPDAPSRRRLAMLQELAQTMTRDARHLALELRPPELDDVGLESALETYVAQWSARFGIAADVEVTGLADTSLPGEAGTTLYRVVQEALTNVAKHAHARHVSVLVERPAGEVRLIVEDDGDGFEVERTLQRATAERRIGLAGMRERAELVGGTMTVESAPGSGTALYVRLPVDLSREARAEGAWARA